MPYMLEYFIDGGYDAGGLGHPALQSACNQLGIAGDKIELGDWPAARTALHNSGYFLNIFGEYLLADSWPSIGLRGHWRDALYWINNAWPTEYKLTMSDVLDVMTQANPVELEYFIGLVDAYRIALWDKPYPVEFYRALGEGFKEWG
jgi:hypothetical protein